MTGKGQPGHPGEPGEPGQPGHASGAGGPGGAGGSGGQGGSGPGGGVGGSGGTGGLGGPGSSPSSTHFAYLITFVVIVALALSVGTLILLHHVQGNTDQLNRQDRAQEAAITAARRAEYRICLRQQVTRAAILLDARIDGRRDRSLAKLSLYDCTPNLTGKAAKLLTARERAAFMAFVLAQRTLP